MKRGCTIVAFCFLVSALAFSQAYLPHKRKAFLPTQVGGGGGGPFYPTNVGTPYTWWISDGAQVINGEVNAITNLYGSETLNLRAYSATTRPAYSNNWLNGHAMTYCNGNQRALVADVVLAQPIEMWMLIQRGDSTRDYQTVFNDDSGFKFFWGKIDDDYDYMTAGGGTLSFHYPGFLNKWIVYTFIADGARSRWLTNNVQQKAGSMGTAGFSALGISGSYWNSYGQPLDHQQR